MLSDSFIIVSMKSKEIPSPTFFVFGSLEGEECKTQGEMRGERRELVIQSSCLDF